MRDYKVIKYSSLYYNEWNDFVSTAKNATFLFHRDFMEYHSDRFEDFSLLIYKEEKLIAILPANKVGNKVYSHQGLSYGGMLLSKSVKINIALETFVALLKYLDKSRITSLILKQLPSIYTVLPNGELDYFAFIMKADLFRKDTLSVINMKDKIDISKNRIEGVKRAEKHNLIVKNNNDFETFWTDVLIKNLKHRYNVTPVHSCEEIIRLKKMFPDRIQLFCVYKDDKMIAGTVIFQSKNVAHSQYISANDERSVLGSLDFLHFHLINNVYKDKLYFDFGSSNITNGKQINKGLQFWKEGFGARTIIQNFYDFEVKNYILLESILI